MTAPNWFDEAERLGVAIPENINRGFLASRKNLPGIVAVDASGLCVTGCPPCRNFRNLVRAAQENERRWERFLEPGVYTLSFEEARPFLDLLYDIPADEDEPLTYSEGFDDGYAAALADVQLNLTDLANNA